MTDRQSQKKGPPGLGRGLSAQGARAYEWALEAVFAIPIGAGLGYLADSQLGTGPWGVMIGLVFGFAAFVLRLMRMRNLVGPTDGEAEEGQDGEPPSEGGKDGR